MPSPYILVVDDDPDIRTVLAAILEEEGFAVTCAVNGRVALAAITSALPLLVLLDMQMPVMDGLELLTALHLSAIKVPVVLMSAACNVKAAAAEQHTAGYLAKPFNLDALLSVVTESMVA